MIVTTTTHAIETAVLRALAEREEYERVTREMGYVRPAQTDLAVAEKVARRLSMAVIG